MRILLVWYRVDNGTMNWFHFLLTQTNHWQKVRQKTKQTKRRVKDTYWSWSIILQSQLWRPKFWSKRVGIFLWLSFFFVVERGKGRTIALTTKGVEPRSILSDTYLKVLVWRQSQTGFCSSVLNEDSQRSLIFHLQFLLVYLNDISSKNCLKVIVWAENHHIHLWRRE